MGFWRTVGYIIAVVMISAGGVIALVAIVASSNIDTQRTQLGNIATLAGVSSLALIGFGSIVSGILLIWALIKSGQIESMEKSLKKIAFSTEALERMQKEQSDKLEKEEADEAKKNVGTETERKLPSDVETTKTESSVEHP